MMVGLAAIVLLPMLLVSVIQAVYHQNVGVLLRSAFVHLPARPAARGGRGAAGPAGAGGDRRASALRSPRGRGPASESALSGLASTLARARPRPVTPRCRPSSSCSARCSCPSARCCSGWSCSCARPPSMWRRCSFRWHWPASSGRPSHSGAGGWWRRWSPLGALQVRHRRDPEPLAVGASGTSGGSCPRCWPAARSSCWPAFARSRCSASCRWSSRGRWHHLEGVRHRVQQALSGPRSAVASALRHATPDPALPELAASAPGGSPRPADAPRPTAARPPGGGPRRRRPAALPALASRCGGGRPTAAPDPRPARRPDHPRPALLAGRRRVRGAPPGHLAPGPRRNGRAT